MRVVIVTLFALLAASGARAQTAADVRNQLIAVCMQASGADAGRCTCFSDAVLGNLTPEEDISLLRGQDTPHSLQVGLYARRRCNVSFPGD